MRIAICPGSFDPVTYGHLDIIRRASQMFDRVVVVVMTNASKAPAFFQRGTVGAVASGNAGPFQCGSGQLRRLAGRICPHPGCYGDCQGPARHVPTFEYEFQMALTNRKLYPGAETVFLTTTAEHMYLSSSLVKQVAELGGDIDGFVPDCIKEDILRKVERMGS